jgi:hypothetical protein
VLVLQLEDVACGTCCSDAPGRERVSASFDINEIAILGTLTFVSGIREESYLCDDKKRLMCRSVPAKEATVNRTGIIRPLIGRLARVGKGVPASDVCSQKRNQ